MHGGINHQPHRLSEISFHPPQEGGLAKITIRDVVAHRRQVESPANFRSMARGYLTERDKMHAEVMAYLSRHASAPVPAEAA